MDPDTTALARTLRAMFPELDQNTAQVLADKFAGLIKRGIANKWDLVNMRIIVQGKRITQLGSALKRHREQAGMSLMHAATAAGFSVSKLIRIENGYVKVSKPDLTFLLHLYRVTDPKTVKALLALAGKPQA